MLDALVALDAGPTRPITDTAGKCGGVGKRVSLTRSPFGVHVLARVHCHVTVKRRFRHFQRGANVVKTDCFVTVEFLGKNDLGLVRPHWRPASFTAASPGSGDPRLCTFLNEPPLELGKRREDVEDEFTRRSRRVDCPVTN